MKIRELFVQSLIPLLFLIDLSAQPPYNQEFQVNTNIIDNPYGSPCVAALLDGGFIIGWESSGRNGSLEGVFAQRFDKNGGYIGKDFQVNTNSGVWHFDPRAIADSDGGFVLCWVGYDQDGLGVFAQHFNKNSERVGNEFQVNTYTNGNQNNPCMSTLSDGGFIIGWESSIQNSWGWDVFARRFNKNGEPVGSEIQVNTYPNGSQKNPCTSTLSNGGIVFSWDSRDQNGSELGIFTQCFNKDGERIGSEFMVNTYTCCSLISPCSIAIPDGGFIIGWNSSGEFGIGRWGGFAQRYNKDRERVGSEFQFKYHPGYSYGSPCGIGLSDGGFIFGWESWGQVGSGWEVFAQRFDRNGNRFWSEFRINSNTKENQVQLCMTSLTDGGIVFGWYSRDQDNSGAKILAKYYLESPIHHTLTSFQLVEPFTDATIQTTQPSFRWQEASDVRKCYPFEIEYTLLLSRDPDFSNYSRIEGIDDTIYTVQSALQPGTTYFWKVLAKNIAGDSLWSSNVNGFYVSPDASVERKETTIPNGFVLKQNYPNPFNPSTEIKYSIPAAGFVTLKIYDIQGRLIRVLCDGVQNAGFYSVRWDGKDESGGAVATGIYVYKLSFKNAQGQTTVISRKMGLVR